MEKTHSQHGAGQALAAAGAPAIQDVQGPTCVSKGTLPFCLAFVAGWYDVVCFQQYKCYANMMTGNTLNMCMNVGNGKNLNDVALIAAAILHFTGGFTFFKFLNLKMKSRGSCAVVAPLIFGLFALADVCRRKYPKSRWHLLLLAIAGGIINSVSAERANLVSNMMTGHYQKLSSDCAEWLTKGLSKEQRASAMVSVRLVATFCSGVSLGMAAWNIKHPYTVLSRRRFAIIGAIYAALLVLHDLPANLFQRRQKRVSAPSKDAE